MFERDGEKIRLIKKETQSVKVKSMNNKSGIAKGDGTGSNKRDSKETDGS